MAKRVMGTSWGLFVICLLLGGCGTGAFQIQMIPRDQELVETQVKRDSGMFVSDKIVVLDIDGVLMNQQKSGWMRSGDNPVSTFIEKLDKAAADENVKAVVLRINSPGGSVAATDAMYHNLQKFKRKKKVPVVACMLDLACSGGYYLACGCDGMMAQPSCVTGSIGTIMQTVSVAGTMSGNCSKGLSTTFTNSFSTSSKGAARMSRRLNCVNWRTVGSIRLSRRRKRD